jgi:hypothetical protein
MCVADVALFALHPLGARIFYPYFARSIDKHFCDIIAAQPLLEWLKVSIQINRSIILMKLGVERHF